MASFGLLILITSVACRKAYRPPAVTTDYHYLVVEGQISTGSDSTMFLLSRTVTLKTHYITNPELNAKVTIEGNDNSSYALQEAGNGKYNSPGLNLGNARQYRLRIITADGKLYLSDFLIPKSSPPIDSLWYTVQPNGVQLYVNTHDATNNTRYYMWRYNETWLFHSAFDSYFIIRADTAALRRPDEEVYYCFRGDTASTIVLNTTAKLSKDIVYQSPVTFISSTSEKIEDRYSILLTQYALTPEAYNYYELLKTNTQNLGSIFDAQPSQLPGNVHCISNPSEPVIGYITAGTVSKKRIFIDNRTLPSWLPVTYYDTLACQEVKVTTTAEFDFDFLGKPPYFLPTTLKTLGGTPECVDCTFRGTKTVPSFWK